MTAVMEEEWSSSLSFLLSQLDSHRFEDSTLRILESILVTKDLSSLTYIRSNLQGHLRSKAAAVLRRISGEGVGEKLRVAEFFAQAFALIGDARSCLALKYEALLLRELTNASNPLLKVSFEEWLTFAEDSFHCGFYSIAVKGFNNALLLVNSNGKKINDGLSSVDEDIVIKIKRSRDLALAFVSSCSVRSQAAKYLSEKRNLQINGSDAVSPPRPASSMFREAIKKRNFHNLVKSRRTCSHMNWTARFEGDS